jgi:hypothetical protein
MASALYICKYIFIKENKMKQLLAIILATFALTGFAADPAANKATEVAKADAAKTAKAPEEMKLAKKQDHSKDAKVDHTKSPSKTTDTKKAETTKK